MVNKHLVYGSIILSGIVTIMFILMPDIDIACSNLFYSKAQGFAYANNQFILFFFEIVPPGSKLFLLLCAVHFIFYAALKRNHRSKTLAILSLYLMLASLIGPGITVNYLFKEKIGRARPKEIQTFGGEKIFTKAAQMTDQCEHNCSFSSGHAAMGYYFTALAYAAILHSKLTKKKQLLELGENNAKPAAKRFNLIYSVFLVFGSLVGFSRVVMGGHFISDVSASCCAVLLINHLCYLLCQRLLCRKF